MPLAQSATSTYNAPPRRKKKHRPSPSHAAPAPGPHSVGTGMGRSTPAPGPHSLSDRERRRNARTAYRVARARARVEAAQNELAQTGQAHYSEDFFKQVAAHEQAVQMGTAPRLLGGSELPKYTEGLADKIIRQFGEATIYSVPGTYEFLKGVGLDTRDIASQAMHDVGLPLKARGYTPSRTTTMTEQMAKQVAGDIRHPLRNPGYTLFDALAIGSGVYGAAARGAAGVGAFSASRAEGAGLARALGSAAVRPGWEGGSFLRKPIPGRSEIAPGVFQYFSTNPLAKGFQKVKAKAQRERPESHIAAGTFSRTEASRIGYERRRQGRIQQDIAGARSSALKKEARKTGKPEQLAVRLVGEQAPLADRIRVHEAELAKIKRPMSPTSYLRYRKLKERIKLLEEVQRRGLVTDKGKVEPTAALRELVRKSESSVFRRQDILKELGLATEERLAARTHAPARVIAGAEYVKPTPGRRGIPSQHELKVEARVTRLEQLHEKALERAKKRAKEYPPEIVGMTTRVREVPRTKAEAQARLAKLDKVYEKKIKQIEDELKGGSKADRSETARRNMENRIGRRGRGGKKKIPTVNQEIRKMAEDIFDKALKDPKLKRLAAAMEERQKLRDALSDPEHVFGGAKIAEGALGHKKVEEMVPVTAKSEMPAKGTFNETANRLGAALSVERDRLERARAARARRETATGLVGGEGARPGRFYVPGAERRGPAGRAAASVGSTIGVPRAKKVMHGTYTGVSTRLATDPIQAVRAIAENEQEAQRMAVSLRNRDYAETISIGPEEAFKIKETNPGAWKHYGVVRVRRVDKQGRPLESAVPFSQHTRDFIERMNEKQAEGLNLTRKEKKELRRMGDDAVDFFFPNLKEGEAFAKAAEGEVRFVDLRKLGGANEPSTLRIGGKSPFEIPARLADEFNAAAQIAILFLKPAYLVPNMIGQVALALIHQGFLAPVNLVHAAKTWKDMTLEERAIVKAGIDEGIARGAQWGGRVAGPVRDVMAQGYGKVLDSPFRWPAFIHEMRKLGYRNPHDIARALHATEGKVHNDVLEAFQRTRDAMVDYSNLTPWEQRLVRRVVFFYPWVKGSTLYTARFLRDHPIQAAFIAQAGRAVAPDIRRQLGPVPFYARGVFPVGKDPQGRPLVVDPTAAQLFGYPTQILEAAKAAFQLNPKPSYTLTDFLSPAPAALLQIAVPHDPLSGYQLPSIAEGLKRQLVTGLPQYRLIEGIRHPSEGDKSVLYPTSPATAIEKYVIGGVFPHPVNVSVLNSRARAEGEAGMSPAERAYRKVMNDRTAVWQAAKKYAPGDLVGGRLPATVREAFNRKAARDATLAAIEAKTDPKTVDRERAKYKAEVALLLKWQIVPKDQAAAAMAWSSQATYEEIVKARGGMSDRYFAKAYNDLLLDVHNFLISKGATFAAG